MKYENSTLVLNFEQKPSLINYYCYQFSTRTRVFKNNMSVKASYPGPRGLLSVNVHQNRYQDVRPKRMTYKKYYEKSADIQYYYGTIQLILTF